jgi:hypothetical protein
MGDWVQPVMTRERCERVNALLDELLALRNVATVEGQPLQVTRDPTGWVMSLDLASLTGPTAYGTSASAATSPPGQLSPPTLTAAGPPTWTPPAGTYPLEWSSVSNTLYAWNGATWVAIGTAVSGSVTFGSTTSVSVPPTTQLVLPTLNTVGGPPTYPGTKGEVVCDGLELWQYTGSTWVGYYPLNVTPGTTNNTAVAPPTYPQLPTLTATGAPTMPLPAGVEILNTIDKTLYVSVTPTQIEQVLTTTVPVTGPVKFPSTPSLVTPITGYLTFPTVTVTGVPTQTLPFGTVVGNTVDNKFYISLGGGTVKQLLVADDPVVGTLSFGVTGSTGTKPPGTLVLPVMTVAGPPTWASPTLGEIVTDANGDVWEYDGAAWEQVGGGITGSLTAGRVVLSTGGSTVGDSASLTFDDANKKLVIAGPGGTLTIDLSNASSHGIVLGGGGTGTIVLGNDTDALGFFDTLPSLRKSITGVLSGTPTLAQLTDVVRSIVAGIGDGGSTGYGLMKDSTT